MKSFAEIISKGLLMLLVFIVINLATILLVVDENEWNMSKRTSETIYISNENEKIDNGTKIVKKINHLLSVQINHLLHKLDQLHIISMIKEFMGIIVQRLVFDLTVPRIIIR